MNKDFDKNNNNNRNFELEWIELKEAMTPPQSPNEEPVGTRMWRKAKENPLVPIGMVATTFCLGNGLLSMKRGDHRKQQLMMRGRVLAQGFTVLAIVSGIMISLANKAVDSVKHS